MGGGHAAVCNFSVTERARRRALRDACAAMAAAQRRDKNAPTRRTDGGVAHQRAHREDNRTHRVRLLGVGRLVDVRGTRDQRIATVATAQRGLIARWQLLDIGISSRSITRLLAVGSLHRVHRGVYAVGHVAAVSLSREAAAVLACRHGAALSHRTAASLWRLCPPIDAAASVDVTVDRSRSGRRPGIRFHRTRHLDPRDIRTLDRLPLTSPARTLLDIAPLLNDRELERAFDEGLVRRIVRTRDIADVIGRHKRNPGAARLAKLLGRRGSPTITRSQAEERFLALIRAAEVDSPRINVRLHGYEVDFLWRERRLVVEVDGYTYHSSRSAFERDRRKDAVLRAAGFDVIRVTWLQMQDEPYAVISRLAQALARAEPRAAAM